MCKSIFFQRASISILALILWCGLNPLQLFAQDDGLRTGAAGGGEVLTNANGTIARRRKRAAKPKATKTQPKATARRAEEYFNQGNEYFEKAEYEQAVKAYEQAIRLNPDYEEAYSGLGDAHLKLGEDEKASQAYEQAEAHGRVIGKITSGGVVNGKAISLPKPQYPPIAKAARVSGTVVVQVLIDEDGDVISASAVSGHPLLRSASVKAAMEAKFSPHMLSGQPVKVTGTINYNFGLE